MFISENTTPFLAEVFPYQDKRCFKFCVAVIRCTFDVDADGACRPSEEQSAFVYADTHYGDPEITSVRVESDFVPVKPRCEVLLDAFAMAPNRQRVEALEVVLVGPSLTKHATVIGERRWFNGHSTRPAPFVTMPLAWHLAFGGTDRSDPDPSRHRSDPRNPVGRGFVAGVLPSASDGAFLPSIEDPKSRVGSPLERPAPVGFGPLPRFARDRARFAGTYDQHWMDNVLPFLPQDFDDRYFQAAPEDQQLEKLAEGMTFGCMHMNESGKFVVRIPALAVPIRAFFDDRIEQMTVIPDTLTIQPHEKRIVLVGRAGVKLPRKFTRLQEIKVGSEKRRPSQDKPHYSNLGDAVRALAKSRRRP